MGGSRRPMPLTPNAAHGPKRPALLPQNTAIYPSSASVSIHRGSGSRRGGDSAPGHAGDELMLNMIELRATASREAPAACGHRRQSVIDLDQDGAVWILRMQGVEKAVQSRWLRSTLRSTRSRRSTAAALVTTGERSSTPRARPRLVGLRPEPTRLPCIRWAAMLTHRARRGRHARRLLLLVPARSGPRPSGLARDVRYSAPRAAPRRR
jgi:hypothetical protein